MPRTLTLYRPFSRTGATDPFDLLFAALARFPVLETSAPPSLALNLSEDEAGYHASLLLPGANADQIEVNLQGNTLLVRWQRDESNENKQDGWLVREFSLGRAERAIRLPQDADLERIEARYENGVLLLDVPKKESAKPKRIPILPK